MNHWTGIRVLLLVLLVLTTCAQAEDPGRHDTLEKTECFTVNGTPSSFINLKSLLKCFRTVPMNVSIAASIVEYAQYAFELHSIRNYVPGATKTKMQGLHDMFTDSSMTSFALAYAGISEFDFNVKVADAFLAAKDRHFIFLSAPLFAGSFIVNPMVIASRVNPMTGKQELYLEGMSAITSVFENLNQTVPSDPSFNTTAATEEFKQHINESIIEIDGMQVMSSYLAEIYYSMGIEDEVTAFNIMLNNNFQMPLSFGPMRTLRAHTSLYDQGISPQVDQEVFSVKFASGVVLKYPKVVRIGRIAVPSTCSRTPPSDTIATDMYPVPEGINDKTIRGDDQKEAKSREVDGNSKARKRRDIFDSKRRAIDEKFLINETLGGEIRAFFILNEEKLEDSLAVLRIHTFSSSNGVLEHGKLTRLIVQQLMDISAAVGSSNLVIDLTSNGGGYVLIQELLLRTLFPQIFDLGYKRVNITFPDGSTVEAPIPIRMTNANLMRYRARVSAKITLGKSSSPHPVVHATRFRDVLSPSWFTDWMNTTWNAVGEIEPFYVDENDYHSKWWTKDNLTDVAAGNDYDTPYFLRPLLGLEEHIDMSRDSQPYTNITLTSDGNCGSACSMFERRLRRFAPPEYVTTVTYGGLMSKGKPRTSLFTGGSVLKLRCPPSSISRLPVNTSFYRFPGSLALLKAQRSLEEPAMLPVPLGRNNTFYYPVDMSYNVHHVYLDHTKKEIPIQFDPVVADVHIPSLWEPTQHDLLEEIFGRKVQMNVSAFDYATFIKKQDTTNSGSGWPRSSNAIATLSCIAFFLI